MKNTPICPLMTQGEEAVRLCEQEKCAWYIQGVQACSMYVMAKEALLTIKEKQNPTK